MRKIWPYCNVYSKGNGLQFGATIQRAKNMQYTTQESHRSCSMQKKKNGYKKNITFEKCQVFEKQQVLQRSL